MTPLPRYPGDMFAEVFVLSDAEEALARLGGDLACPRCGSRMPPVLEPSYVGGNRLFARFPTHNVWGKPCPVAHLDVRR